MRKIHFYGIYGILGFILIITSCATSNAPITIPTPLRPPLESTVIHTPASTPKKVIEPTEPSEPERIHFSKTPQFPTLIGAVTPQLQDDLIPKFPNSPPVKINVENLPLPAFINEVFGNLLGLTFEIDTKLKDKKDLVTLRINQAQQPAQFYRLARQVLANYGVAIDIQKNLIRFVVQTQQESDSPALLIRGETLPEVPPSNRPIFQFVQLKVSTNAQIMRWLKIAYKNAKLQILEVPSRNAILLIGRSQLVREVTKAIKFLDQPWIKGQYSIRIEPVFLNVNELANHLVKILNTQGYTASTNPTFGSIILLPIKPLNAIFVFAADVKILAHVKKWAEQLDYANLKKEPKKPGEPEHNLFFYPVKHTLAAPMASVLNTLLRALIVLPRGQDRTRLRMITDGPRNTLLFVGTNQEWARLLPILQKMDQPDKQVLIEATIAEVTLTDEAEHGVEWTLDKADIGGLEGNIGTLGKLGVGGSGLSYVLSNAGQSRAILNAFASNSRATILSTPRLMVRSGSQASMDVGTEIPTLSSQTTSNQQLAGDSAILQQIQYRRTGTSLKIKPTVYAGRRVDLEITQEVSQAQPNTTSNIDSPVIFNRKIATQLSLSDGQSVLLGGMIENTRTKGNRGIPILKDIPLIGQLFRVDQTSAARTELVVLIIPYIINDEREAKAITESLEQRLELLPSLLPKQ
ncbi:type II secretion system protein GspD [Candidatus Parabeggiatoa sp. HSG14]|uniref:type II secretion system protein GspD n=1 Tax=Candidatus Parabeggiatoa sp. HSG14 TaxID=3055593 RepID=UPI0025A8EAB9|nr:type II secretion system protein GspD [Thiotrichales bacterium HSG14]